MEHSENRQVVLHFDPWPSCESNILCTGRTCENKRKQSGGWMKICGCYERIYADTHVRCGESLSWSLSLQPEEIRFVTEAPASDWAPRWGSGLQWTSSWEPRYLEEEEVLSGALKITQHGMVKSRRSYGSMWQSPFVSLRLSLSRHGNFDFKKNRESYIFITKYCGFFPHREYITGGIQANEPEEKKVVTGVTSKKWRRQIMCMKKRTNKKTCLHWGFHRCIRKTNYSSNGKIMENRKARKLVNKNGEKKPYGNFKWEDCTRKDVNIDKKGKVQGRNTLSSNSSTKLRWKDKLYVNENW